MSEIDASEFQNRFDSVMNRVGRIEKGLEDVKNQMPVVVAFQDEFSRINGLMKSVKDFMQEGLSKLEVERAKDSRSLDAYNVVVGHVQESIEALKRELDVHSENMSSSLEDFFSKHTSLKSTVVHSNEFESFCKSQRDLFENHQKGLLFLNDKCTQLQKMCDSMMEKHKANEEFKKSCSDSHSSLCDDLERIEVLISQKVADIYRAVDIKIDAVNQKLAKNLDSVKDQIASAPSSLGAAKEEIYQKFNAAELDASNALLKAKNNDQQIRLLEKKLENVQLLLKKYELNQ